VKNECESSSSGDGETNKINLGKKLLDIKIGKKPRNNFKWIRENSSATSKNKHKIYN